MLNTFNKYGLDLEVISYNCINKNNKIMSEFKHKNGSGSIFKNNYKEKENQPDYKGSVVLQDGTDQSIALWIKDTKDGGKFFSVAITNPYQKKEDIPNDNESKEDGLPF